MVCCVVRFFLYCICVVLDPFITIARVKRHCDTSALHSAYKQHVPREHQEITTIIQRAPKNNSSHPESTTRGAPGNNSIIERGPGNSGWGGGAKTACAVPCRAARGGGGGVQGVVPRRPVPHANHVAYSCPCTSNGLYFMIDQAFCHLVYTDCQFCRVAGSQRG